MNFLFTRQAYIKKEKKKFPQIRKDIGHLIPIIVGKHPNSSEIVVWMSCKGKKVYIPKEN